MTTRAPYSAAEARDIKVKVLLRGLEHECLLRPLGNVAYVMPPYVITPGQIDHMVDTAIGGIEWALG